MAYRRRSPSNHFRRVDNPVWKMFSFSVPFNDIPSRLPSKGQSEWLPGISEVWRYSRIFESPQRFWVVIIPCFGTVREVS